MPGKAESANSDDVRQRFRDEAWPWVPALLRTARVLSRDVHAADDLVQETMLRAMKHIGSFEQGTNMRAWLLTILRRTHVDLYRSDRRHRGHASLHEVAEPMAAADALGAHDSQWIEPEALLERFEDEAVIDAIRALPQDMRWTLLLADVEQLSHVEVAEVMGVAVGTVKSRVHRARAAVRDQLFELARARGWVDRTGDQP